MDKSTAHKFCKNRKGIEPLLAGALYIGIAIAAVTAVISIGMPAIEKMTDVAAIDQAKDALTNMDRIIRQVAAEGFGSTRIVPLEIRKGDVVVNPAQDIMYYELETLAEVISPRTKSIIGNLIFSSNALVTVSENSTAITIENEHLDLIINKFNSNSTSWQIINASRLVQSAYLIDEDKYLPGAVNILVDNDPNMESGPGYVYAEETGTNLPRGRAIAHINVTRADYDVWLTLESGADFFAVEVKNYIPH